MPPHLSDRDIEILLLMAQGCSDREIGSSLGLSRATVSTYVRDLFRKADSVNRAELVARAFSAGVLVVLDRGLRPSWSGARTLAVRW